METKTIDAKFEFKSDQSKEGRIMGYGAFYGNVDSSDDVIKHGAFSQINRSVKMLYQHSNLIGSWDTVREDSNGLIVEGNVNLKTTIGADVYELAAAGDLTDLSVGFKTLEYNYDDKDVRHIQKADLYEVSLVAFPANEKANVLAVKSEDVRTERDFEHLLKSLGFSNKQAKHITSFGYKSLITEREDTVSMNDVLKQLKDFNI